jgi:hypothetical protein
MLIYYLTAAMKKIYWLVLVAGLVCCDKESLPQNFLEKYDNTYWEADDGGSSNIGFYNDPLKFVYTASCTRAGFGDFVIDEADDFLITKNTLDELHFSIVFLEECTPTIYLEWKVKTYEDDILILTRKKLIGYRNCELYKDEGDFSTPFRLNEKTLDEVCASPQPFF